MKGGLPLCAVTAQYNDELRHIEYAVEKYSKMLFRICYGILCNKEDAEDALQETFLKYMLKAPLFRDSEHEKAWLIKVATNISKNMCRFNSKHAADNLDELRDIGINDDDMDVFELIMLTTSQFSMDFYYFSPFTLTNSSVFTEIFT